MKKYNVHKLVNINIDEFSGEVEQYLDLEFAHLNKGTVAKNSINVKFSNKIEVTNEVYALGKGLFYDEVNKLIYIRLE